MTKSLFVAMACAAQMLGAAPASAATFRVDDSGTVLSQAVVPMKWRQLVPGRGADNTVEGRLRVALRLNLAPWVNQPVRLYMGLQDVVGRPIETRWQTQGRLLPGTLRSGGRALVFDGIVSAAVLEETIELALAADGRTLDGSTPLQFYFEVETQ